MTSRGHEREERLSLAHALRTPLTSIVLGLGLLDEGTIGPLSDKQREVVRAIIDDAARLQRLVESALRIDRLGSYAGPTERERVDLADLVARSVSPIEHQAAPRGVELRKNARSGLVVSADPVKLGWVVAAIAGNALRFSPPKSTIRIVVKSAGEEARVEIGDEGPGIPPSIRRRLFERAAGYGLTLPLAREIVEAHGGSIRVRSMKTGGSTFLIALPLVSARGIEP